MPEIRIETLTPWIELLCEAGDARARDRLLLEGVLALDLADAAAIWRRGGDGAWKEHVARGPAERLPRAGDVEAIAERRIQDDVLPARRVHVRGDVALALGGVTEERDPSDVAESLLAAYALVDAGSTADAWPAPLPVRATDARREVSAPGSEEARRVHHDLRNVLTSLRATEDLLARFSEGLSADESERFRTAVERECARAGALLAEGISAQGLLARDPSAAGLGTEGVEADGIVRPRASVESSGVRSPQASSPTSAADVPTSAADAPTSAADAPTSAADVPTSAADVIEHVLDAERAAFATAHIELCAYIDPAVRRVRCALSDSDLGRIVLNLLVNARQALARGRSAMLPDAGSARVHRNGCVWLTLERTNSGSPPGLVLVVEDDGPGIGPRDLERVFEVGFSSRTGANVGRGLAIVRSLAEASGGSARAECRVLGGARLRVRLPCRT